MFENIRTVHVYGLYGAAQAQAYEILCQDYTDHCTSKNNYFDRQF